MDNFTEKNVQITKGSASLRLREILMDSDGLLTIVKLNFFFIITALPFIPFIILFTGGPSITALLYCTNQLVRTGTVTDVGKTYFNIFKNNIKKTVVAGAVVTIFNILFLAGFMLYLSMAATNTMYIPFASVSLLGIIFIWAITIHLFHAFNENDKSTKELLTDAVSLTFSKMKATIIAVVLSIAVIFGIILALPKTLPLLLTVIFSVPALAAGFAHSDREFISDII